MFDPNGGSAMRGLVEALVDADADINKFDEANWTPLYQSASAGDLGKFGISLVVFVLFFVFFF